MGAPMPQTPGQSARTPFAEARAQHWAFQPLGKPSTPVVRNTGWVKTPVDRFILETLEKKQLEPAAPADRRTLIRRVTYDLIGLPPTPAEVETFVKDSRPEVSNWSSDCWPPRIMGRGGAAIGSTSHAMPTRRATWQAVSSDATHSLTYRDYVVRSFNQDKPYNEFS
jgi:hypothetical protein